MTKSSKKHIPTLLGIFILILGMSAGVILLNAQQVFKLGAREDTEPKNFRVSNISDSGFTISFITASETRSFVKVSSDKYFLGETQVVRQEGKKDTHYFDITNLSPDREYFVYANTNGKDHYINDLKPIKTGTVLEEYIESQNLYGKVYSESGEEQEGAIVYVQAGNGGLLSALTAYDGSFVLTVSKCRNMDLSGYEKIDPDKTLIQILVQRGLLTSSVTAYMKNAQPLPPIVLGNNQDVRSILNMPADMDVSTPRVFGSSTYLDQYPFLFKSIFKLP